jgi:hypothetical protein
MRVVGKEINIPTFNVHHWRIGSILNFEGVCDTYSRSTVIVRWCYPAGNRSITVIGQLRITYVLVLVPSIASFKLGKMYVLTGTGTYVLHRPASSITVIGQYPNRTITVLRL